MGVSQCIHIVTSGVHVFPACEVIRLSAKASCPIADEVVEPREVLRPPDLSSSELFVGGKVFKVLVVGEY